MSLLDTLARFFSRGRAVPARGSEYVVGLDTREPQFMVPNQALTVRLPRDAARPLRWTWDAQTCFEVVPIAPPATETDATGRTFDVWRFRTTGELGVCFLRFLQTDPAAPGAPASREFVVTVKVGRY